jgi:hypothetical protein
MQNNDYNDLQNIVLKKPLYNWGINSAMVLIWVTLTVPNKTTSC